MSPAEHKEVLRTQITFADALLTEMEDSASEQGTLDDVMRETHMENMLASTLYNLNRLRVNLYGGSLGAGRNPSASAAAEYGGVDLVNEQIKSLQSILIARSPKHDASIESEMMNSIVASLIWLRSILLRTG